MVRQDTPESDCFISIGYDLTARELELTFASGKTYILSNVDPLTALGLSEATSKGEWYHMNIKGQYTERRTGCKDWEQAERR